VFSCTGGKYNRATLCIETVQELCRVNSLNIKEYWNESLILGWLVEILQALFLVADDMMDKSETRRGKTCWYLLPDIHYDAVNDTLILESFLFYLINKYLSYHNNYIKIVELYQSVSLQTQLGQMLDLLSQPQMKKDPALLNNFTLENYKRIVCYKTAIYTFYLPIAAGLLLCNKASEKVLKVAREISIELGEKFQIEDDFLDCYQKPEILGKIGTDIWDHKCSWLIVQALMRVNTKQRKIIENNYGKKECEQIIKDLYNELDLKSVYEQQEANSYERIIKLVNDNQQILPKNLFLPILNRIHKRQK
jgi:farnesyl diphosphate synthase